MNLDTKRLTVIIGIGLLAAIVVYLTLEVIIVGVVSAVVASVVALLVYRYLDKKPEKTTPAQEADPAAELQWLLNQLIELNITSREEGISEDVLVRVEGIIDKLRQLLPDINERHRGNELTWTVNQMAKDYLPRLIRPYVSLSASDQQQRRLEFLNSLNGLEAELDIVAELVNSEKLGDFRAKAAFLRARFIAGD